MWAIANKIMAFLTFGVCVAQMAWWYGQLPDPLPSHFDANGQVDGEMGKNAFYLMMGLVNAMFLVGFPVLAMTLKHIPDSLINLPNKEYWLAPGRRNETLATTSQFLIATGWMSVWLMIGIFHLTAEVATHVRDSVNPEVYWISGIYLVILTAATIWLCRKFRVPKSDATFQPQ